MKKMQSWTLPELVPRDVLAMKKSEIEKTKPTLIISVLKVDMIKLGLFFFDFQLFHYQKFWQING